MELTATTPEEVALSEIGGTGDLPLRLRIHDSSRFEWTLSIPLPAARKVAYDLLVQLEVPAGAVGRQNPWEQLQTFSRLDGPTGAATSRDVSVDALRRGAVNLTQMLAPARHGFARRSEEHTSELQSPCNLVCRLLLEKKKKCRHMTPTLQLLAMNTSFTLAILRYTELLIDAGVFINSLTTLRITHHLTTIMKIVTPSI